MTDPEVKETHGIYGGGKEYGKVLKNKNKVWFINVGGT